MTSPARHLSKGAENVRQFNHASQAIGKDWEFPSASYYALSSLSQLVGMMPQALEQSIRPVNRTYEHGRLKIDQGGDADEAMRRLRIAYDDATEFAEALKDAVSAMHAATSTMGLDTAGLPGFED